MTIDLRNWLRSDTGVATDAATVEAFVSGTAGTPTTAATATTSTEANEGRWAIEGLAATEIYDVKITSGNQVRWQKGAASPLFFEVSAFDRVQVGNGAVGRPSLTFLNDPDSGFYRIGANNIGGAVNGAKVLDIGTAGLDVTGRLSATTLVYVNETANANMTLGLTINQGANDDEIMAFKSSDVDHGMTGLAETDTYLAFQKATPTGGGGRIMGLSDPNDTTKAGLWLVGISGVAADTTKSNIAIGVLRLEAYVKSGTGGGAVGADGNLLTIANQTATRFIFDQEGSAHADTEWVAFDDHDDLALLNQLDAAMTRDPIKTEFGRFLGDYRHALQDAKIANFYDPNGPRAMINWTRLAMLTVGAIRQLGQRLALAEARLALLPSAN